MIKHSDAYPMVEITWEDPTHFGGWQNYDASLPYEIRTNKTLGYLLSLGPAYVVLAMSVGAGYDLEENPEDAWGEVFVINASLVSSIRYLEGI